MLATDVSRIDFFDVSSGVWFDVSFDIDVWIAFSFTMALNVLKCFHAYYASFQASGIGKLKPNILLMGFKENWQTSERNEIVDYVEVMQ